eukprot:scaffold18711_cov119-Isochrysis_galbana.AAC.14
MYGAQPHACNGPLQHTALLAPGANHSSPKPPPNRPGEPAGSVPTSHDQRLRPGFPSTPLARP